MITDEVFLVDSKPNKQFFTSRRELAKAILKGYVEIKQKPLIMRYQRGPTDTQNDDIGPQVFDYYQNLPNYVMANVHERKHMTDALEDLISSTLK